MIARIELKDGATITGNAYINEMLRVLQFVYGDAGATVCVITSGTDGTHGPNSYHAKGRALDARFWNIPEADRPQVAINLRKWLPAFYDVVMEADHFHIESDAAKEAAWLKPN